MIIRLLSVGKVRGILTDAIEEFERRAERYWRIERIEVEGGAKGSADPDRVRKAEGARLAGRLDESGILLLLSRDGTRVTSRGLADLLNDEALFGGGPVTFIIGGAFGVDRGMLPPRTRTIALSGMTLPHDMARLLLAEQLYRAGTILRGEPYHKGREG